MKKIAIVVNKNWETEPVLDAMTNAEIRPAQLPFPEVLNSPKDKTNKMRVPRAVFKLRGGKPGEKVQDTLLVHVWCIQDLMAPDQSSSSSKEKFDKLPPILKADNPDLVIAVGTAGYPKEDESFNGSVVIGANFFMHDGHPGNPKSDLTNPNIGKVLYSNVNDGFFDPPTSPFTREFKSLTEAKFLKTPRNPAANAVCMAAKVNVAISVVNVTDYTEYSWVDHEAIASYKKLESRLPLSSSETTHGVIKISTDKPIIFVSGITDRLGAFDTDVTPSQNYVASFNAGIVLGQLVCSLNDMVLNGFDFGKKKS